MISLWLIIWRFQPLHRGHILLIEKSLNENPATLVLIGSSENKDEKNPYSYVQRKEFILWEFPKTQPHLWISSPQGEEGKNMRYLYNQVPEYVKILSKKLRYTQTPHEEVLWHLVRNRKFHNLKFRRQHAIWRYIADFYCDEKKVVIELDGVIHERQKEYDMIRDDIIESHGIHVVRLANSSLENYSPKQIYSKLEQELQSLSLLKEREFKSEVCKIDQWSLSIAALPDFPEDSDWVAHILLHIPERVSDCYIYCGDTENDYAIQVLKKLEDTLPFTLHIIEIDRKELPISWTQVRKDLEQNDIGSLKKSLWKETFKKLDSIL